MKEWILINRIGAICVALLAGFLGIYNLFLNTGFSSILDILSVFGAFVLVFGSPIIIGSNVIAFAIAFIKKDIFWKPSLWSLIIIVIGFTIFAIKPIFQIDTTPPPPASSNTKDHDAQAKEIIAALEEENYCTDKNDCVIESYGCPFGCYTLLNKNYSKERNQQLVQTYQNAGNQCVYDCDRAPTEEEVGCVNNKCVDMRYQ